MLKRITLAACALGLLALPAGAGKSYSHQEYFEHYEGTATCLQCHEDEAKSFFATQHYQWRAAAPNVVGADGQELGKINMVNDYCTNPRPNWIGKITNAEGKVLEAGCSKCHAGRGKLPSPVMSEEQLLNIDCLICHAHGYRRDLYANPDGSWEWKPILWKNVEGLDSVSKRITKPTRTMCLRCHAGSGGGPNFKRGDLEYAQASEADEDFDVHMAADGTDLQCIDCHAGADHRIPGPGADIAGNEMPATKVACDSDDCHGNEPHASSILNTHTRRVFCTACHIPSFAKEDPTNMVRDWSHGSYDEAKGKYVYDGVLSSDVEPVLAWWNGSTTEMQLAGEPVATDADGRVKVAVPVGRRDDPSSRLYAFKLYQAVMPVLTGKRWLLPIETGHFYRTGNMDEAVRNAAEELYGLEDVAYTWEKTVHYQGLFHEVQPASNALRCLDCHGPDGRLDWQGLGYDADPLAACLQPSH